MNKNQKEEIKMKINTCKMKLQTIMPHLSEEKHGLNETFNKLLIEKAILRDKLMKDNTSTFFCKIIKKIKEGKKELICDFFK